MTVTRPMQVSAPSKARPEFTVHLRQPIEGQKAMLTSGFMVIRGILSVFVSEQEQVVRVSCLSSFDKDLVMQQCQEFLRRQRIQHSIPSSEWECEQTSAPKDGMRTPQMTAREVYDREPAVTPCTPVMMAPPTSHKRASPTSPEEQLDDVRHGAKEMRSKRDSIGGAIAFSPALSRGNESAPTYLDPSKFQAGDPMAVKQHASELTAAARAARKAEFARDQARTSRLLGAVKNFVSAPIQSTSSFVRWAGGWAA